MKIKVLHNYGGSNTNERRILPGIYDSEDSALFGLADYLVENGHAIDVTPVSAETETDIRQLDSKMELPSASEPPNPKRRK